MPLLIPPLADGPVSLRPLAQGDAPHLLRWLTDPAVLEWYEGRDKPFTPALIQEHFYNTDERLARCAVLFEGRPVGYVQVYPLEGAEREEYGCPVGSSPAFAMDQFLGEPACWGRHIGRRFMGLLLGYLVLSLDAQAVYVDPHADNLRAIRCYKACGFRAIKPLPHHELHEGRWLDCLLMGFGPGVP